MYLSTALFFSMSVIMVMIMMLNSNKSASKMIFSLICMIILTSFIMYKISKKSWVSISLFIAMVGGMMILFSLTALVYPKMMNSSSKIMMIMILIPMPMMFFHQFNRSFMSTPILTFHMKMNLILIIIIILNLMLTYVSKLIISPNKPFRSVK